MVNNNFPSNNNYFSKEKKANYQSAITDDWDIMFYSLNKIEYNTKKYKSLYEAVSRYNVKVIDNYNVYYTDCPSIYTSGVTIFNKDDSRISIIFPIDESLIQARARLLVNSDDTYHCEWQE